MENSILTIKKLSFSYGEQHILRNISFELGKGEVLGLIGRSGSGKTSLLKLVAGLLEPGGGKIHFKGDEVKGPSQQLIPGHPEIKLVKQDFELMPYLSVEDNMLRQALSLSESSRKRLVGHLRNRLQLQNVKGKKATETSGGQKQRVALATALATKANVLLLDEPFSNLDYALKQDMIAMLRTGWKPKGMILVTHEPQDIMALTDRVIVLKDGKVVQSGKTEEVYAKPRNEYVGRLLGPINVWQEKEGLSPKKFLRPHQIKITPKGTIRATVADCRFSGNGYLLNVKTGTKELQVWSSKPFFNGKELSLKAEA